MRTVRLEQEKTQFTAKMKKLYEQGYISTLSFLNNNFNYFNDIFDEDYFLNIKNIFNLMNEYSNDTYIYMYSLLNETYLKGISKLLSERLKNIFGYVRDETSKLIESKIPLLIYNKIDDFRNEVLKEIPKYFLNELFQNILQSDNFKNSLINEKLYELIPKSYSSGFRANLTSYLFEVLNPLTQQFKQRYYDTIMGDLDLYKNKLSEYHKNMGLLDNLLFSIKQ